MMLHVQLSIIAGCNAACHVCLRSCGSMEVAHAVHGFVHGALIAHHHMPSVSLRNRILVLSLKPTENCGYHLTTGSVCSSTLACMLGTNMTSNASTVAGSLSILVRILNVNVNTKNASKIWKTQIMHENPNPTPAQYPTSVLL